MNGITGSSFVPCANAGVYGVIKQLIDCDVDIDIVSGTSISYFANEFVEKACGFDLNG